VQPQRRVSLPLLWHWRPHPFPHAQLPMGHGSGYPDDPEGVRLLVALLGRSLFADLLADYLRYADGREVRRMWKGMGGGEYYYYCTSSLRLAWTRCVPPLERWAFAMPATCTGIPVVACVVDIGHQDRQTRGLAPHPPTSPCVRSVACAYHPHHNAWEHSCHRCATPPPPPCQLHPPPFPPTQPNPDPWHAPPGTGSAGRQQLERGASGRPPACNPP
jgi:hypothetical protein